MSEINILYGYQLVGCPEEFSQELNEYGQRMKEEGSKVQIIDGGECIYIGFQMYEQSAPEDQWDWERLSDGDILEVPEVFYLPYALSMIAETKSPKIYAFWTLTY